MQLPACASSKPRQSVNPTAHGGECPLRGVFGPIKGAKSPGSIPFVKPDLLLFQHSHPLRGESIRRLFLEIAD